MSLSNNVRTWLVDPTVDNSARTRFRLPEGFLASSLKLIDLGVYDAQQLATTGLYYPSINGVLAAIQRITLYSGDKKIDTIEELLAYASIQHLKTSNQGSEDIHRFELLNGMGVSITDGNDAIYTSQIHGAYTLQRRGKDYNNNYSNFRLHLHNAVKIASADAQQSGQILLSDYLQFLQSTPVLPMIPDLQLEIEWNLNANRFHGDSDAPASVANPVYTHMRPTLVCEELLGMDPNTAKNVKIPYFANLVERFVVPATTNTTVQRVSFRSSAFTNRFVRDFTFFNQPTNGLDDGWCKQQERSPAMYGEKLQLVVNGSKYLPDDGINQLAMKWQYFNDTHGSLNLPIAAGLIGLVDGSGHVLASGDAANAANATDRWEHNYSVTAVQINDVIDRLDIEYQRTGQSTIGTATNQADGINAFNLLCFGRVAKQLEIVNGKIRDSY